MTPRLTPLRIALAYAVLGGTWLLLSGYVVEWALADQVAGLVGLTAKGLVYVAAAAVMVHLVLIHWLTRGARVDTLHDAAMARARADLRDSLAFQRALVDASPLPLFALDPDGRVLTWNDAAERVFGWSEDEVVGEVLPIAHPKGNEELTELRRRTVAGESVSGMELAGRSKDGTPIDLLVSTSPIRDADGEVVGVMTAVEDVTERKLAQKALRLSETRRARAERIARFGTWEWKVATDTVSWSEGTYEIFGLDPEREPPRFEEHDRLFASEDMPRLRAAVQTAISTGEPYELELRAQRDDGHVRRCVVQGQAERGPDGEVERLYGSMRDITERKLAEEALEESERRLRSVVEYAPDAIFVQVDGRFAFVNPACVRLLGAESEDDLLGLPVLDRIPSGDREGMAEDFRILAEERRTVKPHEGAMIRLDGCRVPVASSATPVEYEGRNGALVFLRDVTERKRREAEHERLYRAVEQAGEAVVITDPHGTIEYVNPAFERITGFSREEAIGADSRIQRSGEQDEAFYHEMWETIIGGETWHGRIVNRRKDGTLYTADATIAPVRDVSGTIVNFVAVERDISREIELESQLLQVQKMESIGNLVSGIAHDFNNMLTVILGNLEMTLEETPADDPHRRNLEETRSAARHSSELVGQLLGFARKQIIAPRALDLNDAIEARLAILHRLIGEDLDLRWRPTDEPWTVYVDPAQIHQILTNLLVNARDAIEGVGQITIETENLEFDEAYCADHVGFRPGEYVMLAVSDTGRGMDRETADQVFEPFFTTKPESEGTGLGLSTVYGIVRQNEGFVNVYSEPGEGTTFRIYLPRYVGEEAPARATRRPEGEERGTETILVVEDEPALLKLATHQLESLGYAVLPASHPGEATRFAASHEGPIHLLLTDIVMPGMNGRALYERLLSERPDLACLFMSGYTADTIAHRGVLEEGVHFLQKPFTVRELGAAVREVLDA